MKPTKPNKNVAGCVTADKIELCRRIFFFFFHGKNELCRRIFFFFLEKW